MEWRLPPPPPPPLLSHPDEAAQGGLVSSGGVVSGSSGSAAVKVPDGGEAADGGSSDGETKRGKSDAGASALTSIFAAASPSPAISVSPGAHSRADGSMREPTAREALCPAGQQHSAPKRSMPLLLQLRHTAAPAEVCDSLPSLPFPSVPLPLLVPASCLPLLQMPRYASLLPHPTNAAAPVDSPGVDSPGGPRDSAPGSGPSPAASPQVWPTTGCTCGCGSCG
mmetsp:Transcript_44539/g.137212  ORF Transcript_44539/g.137212 Transcript_44539/m.137212 type:complete len:224 (+) Transcript_44539:1425-2096(+)